MVKRTRPDGYPTRPVSGFILFMNERRQTYVDKLRSDGVQGSIVTHVSRLAKFDWAALGEEGQHTWNGPAAELIQKYNKDVEEFKKNNPQAIVQNEEKTPKKTKKERPIGTPAKTATSYILFSMNERTSTIAELTEAGIELTFSNIAKKTASKWNQLSKDDRVPWDEKAKALATEAKLQAEKELADHLAANPPVVADVTPTDAPVTDAPVTDAPVTDAPVTDAPVTDAPVTDATVKAKRKYVRKPKAAAVVTEVVAETVTADATNPPTDGTAVDVPVVEKTLDALADALSDAPAVPLPQTNKKRVRKHVE